MIMLPMERHKRTEPWIRPQAESNVTQGHSGEPCAYRESSLSGARSGGSHARRASPGLP